MYFGGCSQEGYVNIPRTKANFTFTFPIVFENACLFACAHESGRNVTSGNVTGFAWNLNNALTAAYFWENASDPTASNASVLCIGY